MGRLSFTLRITLFLILTDLQIKCWAFGFTKRGFCATGPPNESLKKAHQDLSALESKHDSASESTDRQVTYQIEIDTWFHIVSSEEDAELVADTMIVSQVSFKLPAQVRHGFIMLTAGSFRTCKMLTGMPRCHIG